MIDPALWNEMEPPSSRGVATIPHGVNSRPVKPAMPSSKPPAGDSFPWGWLPPPSPRIAADAGVSVDTIYKGFGGKSGIVRAICERALAGEGRIPAETRSDALHSTEHDPRHHPRLGRTDDEVAPRVAPILLLIRDAAAADPEMASLQAEMDGQRLDRMIHNARNLAAAGHLRTI